MWGFSGWRWNLPDPPARRAFEILQQQWLVSKTLPTFAVDPHVLEAQRHSWLPSALPELGTFAGLPDFFAERPLLDDVLSRTNSFVGQFGDALGANVGRVIEWPEVTIPIRALADIGRVMSNLPSIWDFSAITEEFRQAMEEARSGEDVLEETHYGFADHLWNTVFLRAFAHVDPKVRHPVVTNKLVAFTRSEAFADTLLREVESSRMLRRRRLVIEAVLKAHRTRDYRLSIPACLPQIEGAVLDAMFLRDLVVKEDDRYYLVDENGERRRNQKTKSPSDRSPSVPP